MLLLFSPLDQFEIIPVIFSVLTETETDPTFSFAYVRQIFVFSSMDFSYKFAGISLISVLFLYNTIKNIFSNYLTIGVNFLYSTIRGMLFGSINTKSVDNLSILFTFFVLILFLNIIGLIPFGFCVTSQIVITQFLGCFAVFGLTLKGIQNLKIKFLNLFVPRNVPILLLPFLSIIEIISYVSRMFSLSIRLFANMVAGHALLHILMGAVTSVFTLTSNTIVTFFLFIIPSIIIFIIFILEVGIAFLQSYVFVVLVSIYLADAYKSH